VSVVEYEVGRPPGPPARLCAVEERAAEEPLAPAPVEVDVDVFGAGPATVTGAAAAAPSPLETPAPLAIGLERPTSPLAGVPLWPEATTPGCSIVGISGRVHSGTPSG